MYIRNNIVVNDDDGVVGDIVIKIANAKLVIKIPNNPTKSNGLLPTVSINGIPAQTPIKWTIPTYTIFDPFVAFVKIAGRPCSHSPTPRRTRARCLPTAHTGRLASLPPQAPPFLLIFIFAPKPLPQWRQGEDGRVESSGYAASAL